MHQSDDWHTQGSCGQEESGAMLLDPGLQFVRLEAACAIDFDRGQVVSEEEIDFDSTDA